MKTKAILASCALCGAVALSVFVGCKKDVVDKPFANTRPQQGYRHEVKQKMYDIPADQAVSLIHIFKGAKNARGIDPAIDSLAVDSSVWLVEAALNYDLDRVDEENYEFETYSISFDAAANEGSAKISTSDIEQVYRQLSVAINAHTDATHKVKVIDLEAQFASAAVLTFTAQVTQAFISNQYSCADVPLDGTQYLSSYQAMTSISPSLVIMCAPWTIDAQSLIQQKLNCPAEIIACSDGGVGPVYMNVGTAFLTSQGEATSNAYPNELFATQLHGSCNPWTPADLLLSDVQVNAYIHNIRNFPVPPGYTKINFTLGCLINHATAIPPCSTWESFGWTLKFVYGKGYCPGADSQ